MSLGKIQRVTTKLIQKWGRDKLVKRKRKTDLLNLVNQRTILFIVPPPSLVIVFASSGSKASSHIFVVVVCVLSCFSCVQLCATLWSVAHRHLYPWDSPVKNTGVGCHALLQGIFLTQGLNPCPALAGGFLALAFCFVFCFVDAAWSREYSLNQE